SGESCRGSPRLGSGGTCGEGCAVVRDGFGDLVVGGGADADGGTAGVGGGVGQEEAGRADENRTAANGATDLAGSDVQPGAVSVCGSDLFELCGAADAAGAAGDCVHGQDAARDIRAGVGGGVLSGVWGSQPCSALPL